MDIKQMNIVNFSMKSRVLGITDSRRVSFDD